MKKLLLYVTIAFSFMMYSCKQSKNDIDKTALEDEVAKSESLLFSFLHEGKINDVLAMHINNAEYKNIFNGDARSYSKMDSVFKTRKANGIKAYNYQVDKRDFMIIDKECVLETIWGVSTVVSDSVNLNSSSPNIVTFLWKKVDNKWMIAYIHGSTKK